MKFNYKKVLFLGIGFFSVSLTWSIFNSFVPLFLRRFVESNAIVGFIMTTDNYLGLFLQPAVGALSDRTRTRLGRRMPYILFGMPAAALLVSAIPLHWSLISLLILIIGFNTVMASFRSPAIALMSDISPGPLRSRANGIINLLGGLGAVIAYFTGSYLYRTNRAYPFYIASVFIIISAIIIFFSIKEDRDSLNFNAVISDGVFVGSQSIDDESVEPSRNTFYLLLAIFFWFISFHGVQEFFTIYATHHLGTGETEAARLFTYLSLSLVAFALPAGYLSEWIGKKKTISLGLILMILICFGLVFLDNIKIVAALFIFAGMCWAFININSYPLLISLADEANIGRFTGYYYLFFSIAAIISPPFLGLLMDIFGYGIFFIYTGIGCLTALLFMLLVRSPREDEKVGKLLSGDEQSQEILEINENDAGDMNIEENESGDKDHVLDSCKETPGEAPEENREEVLEESMEEVPEKAPEEVREESDNSDVLKKEYKGINI